MRQKGGGEVEEEEEEEKEVGLEEMGSGNHLALPCFAFIKPESCSPRSLLFLGSEASHYLM